MTQSVIIYTDGGCSPNPGFGGWGAVLISPTHKTRKELYGSVPDTTNNRMEVLAAIMALRALKQPCNVEIYSDSQYLINPFTKGWKTHTNEDLWKELKEVASKHTISWNWVKGHANNPENNRCDELVQRAIAEYR